MNRDIMTVDEIYNFSDAEVQTEIARLRKHADALECCERERADDDARFLNQLEREQS